MNADLQCNRTPADHFSKWTADPLSDSYGDCLQGHTDLDQRSHCSQHSACVQHINKQWQCFRLGCSNTARLAREVVQSSPSIRFHPIFRTGWSLTSNLKCPCRSQLVDQDRIRSQRLFSHGLVRLPVWTNLSICAVFSSLELQLAGVPTMTCVIVVDTYCMGAALIRRSYLGGRPQFSIE